MCLGASAALARALASAVKENGGEIQLQTTPRKILVENGRVIGVETTQGEVFRARHFVASGLNPHQTFLELIDEDMLPHEWRDKARDFKYNLIAPLFGLYVNLSEPPCYKAADQHPHLRQAFMVILGLEHIDHYLEMVRHHEAGTLPSPVIWGCCPTQFDPSQAPAGKHTAFMWEKAPYRLRGDATHWEQMKASHGQELLAFWGAYAPNLKDALLDSFVQSPLDVERTFPNMRAGDLLIGAFTNDQIGYNRPFSGAGHYRGYLSGLYLCGSCCHPGGNITGLPGYNCAQVILGDLGLPTPWAPEPVSERFKRLS